MQSIDFGDKIDCLVAKKDPIIVALYQPKLNLVSTDTLGPHFESSGKDGEINKIRKFIELSNSHGAKLLISPEYGASLEILYSICRREIDIPQGTLIILPIESISYEKYQNLKSEIEVIKKCDCIKLDVINSHLDGGCVNACAILAFLPNKIKVFLQPKRFASNVERSILCEGKDYFVFDGDGIAMTILICSDANEPKLFNDQIEQTIKKSKACFIVHTQWNPKANYSIYDDLWRGVISSGDEKHVLISANTASGSSVAGSNEVIEIPFVSISCGGDGKPDEKYMNERKLYAFKSLFEQKKYGQVMNFVYPHDGAHIVELRRPYEGIQHAANKTKTFLHSCKTFKFSTEYEELSKEYFVKTFHNSVKEENKGDDISDILENLSSFTPEETEMFVSSCLMEEKYKWLDREILIRPVIWLTFYKSIIVNREAADSTNLFIQCLFFLRSCKDRGFLPFPMDKISNFPVNLKQEGNSAIGWLFHCKGLTSERVAIKSEELLSQLFNIRKTLKLSLFPINCRGLKSEMIKRASTYLTDDQQTIERKDVITDPFPHIELEVIDL